MLDAKTFIDSGVIKYLKENFISLKIDADTNYGSKLFQEYKGTGYPLLLFLDSNKNEIERFYGFYEAQDFLEKLTNIRNGKNTLPAILKNYELGDHSVETLSQLAVKYADRGDDSLATFFYKQTLQSKNLPIKLFYEAKYYLTSKELKFQNSEPLEKYLSDYPDSPFSKDALNQLLGYYKMTKLVEKEIKYFNNYIDKLSDDPWFLNQFAWRMTELNQNLDLALKKVNIALNLIDEETQGVANIIDTKAEVLWKLGKKDEAIQTINKAIILDPTNGYYQEQKTKFETN